MRAVFIGLALCASAAAVQARVTRIVIDETLPVSGGTGPVYEQVAGRAFGELDPQLPGNALIQDLQLAKDADGKVPADALSLQQAATNSKVLK